MSSTRTAETGKPFRQERYISSAQLERGLMGNLVATRCDALEHAEDRELIYFLQLLSHREGGLKKVEADLLARFPENICTSSMLKFGVKAGRNYNGEQVKTIRRELPDRYDYQFLLRGELWEDKSLDEFIGRNDIEKIADRAIMRRFGSHKASDREREEAMDHPTFYPVADFMKICQEESQNLESELKELCLNPAIVLRKQKAYGEKEFAPWYFQNAVVALRQYQSEWIKQRQQSVVVTELGKLVYETLDFTLETHCLTLIDGFARTGKTFAAKAWCDQHPGRARYVQVPSTNDEIGFFRAIAKSLGVSINLNSKAQELRQRIEEVLQRGDLLLCLDEAHYLWPNSNYRDAMPMRVNWIMTALVNQGVAVSLVTTPQFLRTQKAVERKSSWTSEQFIGRIGHYQKLPDSLPETDLTNVAESLLPEGNARAIELLVRYAQSSAKYLAGIESVVRRARYLAGKEGREEVSAADLKRAVQDSVIPSDSALAHAIAEPEKPSRKRSSKALKTVFTRVESPVMRGQSAGKANEDFTPSRLENHLASDAGITPRDARELVPA